MSFSELGSRLAFLGRQKRHRHAVLISGGVDRGLEAATTLCERFDADRRVVFGTSESRPGPPGFILLNSAKQARRYLGCELECAILNCHEVFDPDAVGILAGCITAGGVMVFLTPPLADWPKFGKTTASVEGHGFSACLSRIARILANCPQVVRIPPDGRASPDIPEDPSPASPAIGYSDQRGAIDAVKAVADSSCPAPVVLESDRGRGKSAALGIAAWELIRTRACRIAVTGHGRRSTDTLFAHALQGAPKFEERIRYHSPDALLEERRDIDLLLIDEAATIPLSMLKDLLAAYPRIAFASTVHGYEGTGKGFSVKFHEILDRHLQKWRRVRLEEPIRWSRDDPLESLVNRLLLLDAETSASTIRPVASPVLVEYDPARLADDEERLRNLFAILVQAHYRTSPSDLARILDSRNLRLFGLEDRRGNIFSVALIALEGRLPPELTDDIRSNRRRPKNHLLPEALCAQLGFDNALSMHAARVIRIAVNPGFKKQSYGRKLLSGIIRRLEQDFDLIGASFGLDAPLHGFWLDCGFTLVRMGVRKNRSTGTHSGLVVRGLSDRGKRLERDAAKRFSRNLPSQIPLYFKKIDPQLLAGILRHNPAVPSKNSLDNRDLSDLGKFASGQCNPDRVSAALEFLARMALSRDCGFLDQADRELLDERLIQHKPWSAMRCLAHPSRQPGKREGMASLRRIVSICLENLPTHAANGGSLRQSPETVE
ncbi:MAG: tRNA(Met) cytidine acetyltransferase [Gammaproteobacteria bacterium]|nr:tRNA(Met) cytidine acetyltransferase [Gammaproteobacteria bacterium]MYD76288.1 tRNA(Met) cytidine acetyltransferase [Gammaproteobacteria bacterium]MYJ51326.1 tRNA(Met) cytidine acetyltransferase [Gammaproteobacteria bacterium]